MEAQREALRLSARGVVAALALLCALTTASADTLNGTVIAVQDGDTITVLVGGNTQHRVRLAGIDAPEKGQPFGQQAKESLSALVGGRAVEVHWHKHDRYGRVVGKVVHNSVDINLAQVDAGLAWHYLEYAREQSVADRALYAEAENRAREARLGLWRDAMPMPPWAYRRAKRDPIE